LASCSKAARPRQQCNLCPGFPLFDHRIIPTNGAWRWRWIQIAFFTGSVCERVTVRACRPFIVILSLFPIVSIFKNAYRSRASRIRRLRVAPPCPVAGRIRYRWAPTIKWRYSRGPPCGQIAAITRARRTTVYYVLYSTRILNIPKGVHGLLQQNTVILKLRKAQWRRRTRAEGFSPIVSRKDDGLFRLGHRR